MKNNVDFVAGVFLFIIGIVLLLLPIFDIANAVLVLKVVFFSYVVINFLRFLCNRKTKDLEGLYTSIACLVLVVSLFFTKAEKPLVFSLTVFAFVILNSFIKLTKADYYHDRKNKMWILEVTTLVVFMIAGLLSSILLLVPEIVSIPTLGFLFFTNGFIELLDPIINAMKKNRK